LVPVSAMEDLLYNSYEFIEQISESYTQNPDSEETSSFTVASDTGSFTTVTSDTRFIVHTSTIPFANIFNAALRSDEVMEHSLLCKDCMLDPIKALPLSHKCPCLDLDEDIEEVCFLTFLRLVKNKSEDNMDIPDAKISEFSFCKDSVNILSHKYPRVLRDICQVTGFHQVTQISTLVQIMKTLYWFKFSRINFQEIHKIREDMAYLLKCVKQTIYTINGLLVKSFFIAGDFHYKDLAFKTAKLFDDILMDYIRRPVYVDDNTVAEVNQMQSIMLDLKKSHKHMKTYFNGCDYERRIIALNYKFNFQSLEDFMLPMLNKIEVIQIHIY